MHASLFVQTAIVISTSCSALSLAAGLDDLSKRSLEPAEVSIAAFSGQVYTDRVYVRFANGLNVRIENGKLVETSGAPLPAMPQGTWDRLHDVDDATLEEQRIVAQKYWGRELPDLRNEYMLVLDASVTISQAIDSLRPLAAIGHVAPMPLPVPPPLPPDFRANQGYLNASPVGTSPSLLWEWPGGRGEAVRIADVEYDFNAAHEDLPVVTRLGPLGTSPFDNNHGTAVISILAGRDNNWGVVGGVPNATISFAYSYVNFVYNPGAAVANASAGCVAGDLLLIEQQAFGPVAQNYVPSEWTVAVYNAVVQAVGNGRIVVAAAGNGNQNLDTAIFATGNGGHWPFLAANDSGAIIVGAGAAATGFANSTTPRSRLSFSTYGSRVNVQGWGEQVHAAGYGNIFSSEGTNRLYSATFGGTSSASPIVTNAAATVASIYETVTGTPINPRVLRTALMETGIAQQAGTNPLTQRIGPLPDARAALARVLGNTDCNANQVPDRVDIAMGMADVNGDNIPDVCQTFCNTIDFNADGLFPDDNDLVDFLTVLAGGPCSNDPNCNDIDFNNDGLFPDDNDLIAFLRVLAGGTC